MGWSSLVVCLWVVAVTAERGERGERGSRVVQTAQGPVRGYKDPEYGIYAFQSIPYATAPTGTNRFKAPLPPPVWLQPLEAIDKSVICPQPSILQNPITDTISTLVMQENCLIANVFVPDTEEKNLPVVVYVHGGGFQIGWGNMLIPKKLISENNIITVTFNYRLGVHGFLCLGTEDVPGNAGMKDQVELLRWVQRNIANFGGNPDEVTIAGYSAGSSSVDLLMLSKSAEGLFNKVIPESGANTAAFTVMSDPLEVAQVVAKTMNITDVADVYALEQFYKTTSFEVITKYDFHERPDSTFLFSPCVERPSKQAFLTESPFDILKNGNYKKVPLLYGFANMEGLPRIATFDSWKNGMNEKFSDFLPADLKFDNDKQKEEVAKDIKDFFFGDKTIDNDSVLAYVDYFTDVLFAYATLRSVKLHIDNGHEQVYLYEYHFVDDNTPVVLHTNVKGADHCAQSIAVIGELPTPNNNITLTEDFHKMSRTVRQLWANFIKTGAPVPEGSELAAWPAVRGSWAPHMVLDRELQLRGSLLERRTRFWDSIYDKHYRNPVPPPAPPARHTEL